MVPSYSPKLPSATDLIQGPMVKDGSRFWIILAIHGPDSMFSDLSSFRYLSITGIHHCSLSFWFFRFFPRTQCPSRSITVVENWLYQGSHCWLPPAHELVVEFVSFPEQVRRSAAHVYYLPLPTATHELVVEFVLFPDQIRRSAAHTGDITPFLKYQLLRITPATCVLRRQLFWIWPKGIHIFVDSDISRYPRKEFQIPCISVMSFL